VTLQTENTPGAAGVPAATSPQPEFVRLKQGDTVGSRFVIDERLRDDVIGPVYRAVDEKSGRKIVIVMLDGVLGTDRASTDELRTSIKITTGLAHKNLVSVFGLGRESKRRYIAREFVDGQTLTELLEKKSEAGKSFTLKGAYNLIAHVCNALQYALPHLTHGTLRPGNVLINRTGRVKVADFGLGALRGGLIDRRSALTRWDAMCFPATHPSHPAPASAPSGDDGAEVDLNIEGALDALEASSAAPTTGGAIAARFGADDLFALGAILYALLAGRPLDPDAPGVAPDVAKRLPEGLEKVLLRCWGGDGVARFRDPNELKTELLHIIETNRGSDRDAEGDGLRPESSIVSLEDSPSLAPAPAAPPSRAAAPRTAPGKAAPRAAKKRPEPSPDGGGFVIPELRPAGVIEDDGTTQRWLVEKQGVDYGPFTSKQIIEKLFAEEIVADTNLYDIETDKRLALSEHAVFDDALVSWVHEKAERDKRRAEEAREAADRRRTRMFMSVGLALLLIVGGLGGGFAWYQSTLPKPVKAHLASLVTKWNGALPQILLPDEAPETPAEAAERTRARQADVAGKRARDEARRMAEEERLAASSELDGTSPAGGTGRTFDQGAMNALVAERNPQIIKCLQDEIRRDPARRNFEIKATILPRGDVINVRMEGGTPSGNSCVRSALGSLKVPPFDGTNQTLRLPFNIN
jgi:serine/threonine protein kinase